MTGSRMVKLAELGQRRSAKGTTYFSGFLGDVQILMFADGEITRPSGEVVRTWKTSDPGARPPPPATAKPEARPATAWRRRVRRPLRPGAAPRSPALRCSQGGRDVCAPTRAVRELRSYLGRHQPWDPPEAENRTGWRRHGILVVAEQDPRLSWPERELQQLGAELYGRRKEALNG